MDSQLSKQLRFLRSTLPQSSDDTKSSDSFLFNAKKSASLRTDEIRVLSLSGLNTLVKYDRRFDVFRETLFSSKSLELKRELQSQSVNEKINTSVSNFLRLLGPYILLRPAQKSIEYLVRKYRCHFYNVDELMALFLPYHNTILFPSIIKILHIDGSMWGFLEKLKVTQEAIPRSTIVSRCVNDFTIIEFVLDQLRLGQIHHRAYINFYTTLLVEYINELKNLDDLKLKRILTTIFWSLSHEEFEIRCSGLMILTLVSSKMNFTRELFKEISILVASNIDPIRPRPSLIFLNYMYQSQNTNEMPIPVLHNILERIPRMIEVMRELSTTYDTRRFMTSFLRSLLEDSMGNDEDEDEGEGEGEEEQSNNNKLMMILLNWLSKYEGMDVQLPEFIPDLFKYHQSHREEIRKIVRVLEAKYPNQLDRGIDRSVRMCRVSNDSELLEFIQLTFRGTRHHLTEGGGQTLTYVLFHVDPNMRALGIREMERLVHSSLHEKKEDSMQDEEESEKEVDDDPRRQAFMKFVSDTLLTSLDDASLTVVREVFDFKNILSYVPLAEFVPKSIEVFRKLKPKLRKDKRVGKIIKKVSRLFTNPKLFEETSFDYKRLILPFILEFLYAEKTLKKTNIHIFNSLHQLEEVELFRGSKNLIKRTEGMNAGRRNFELIKFLAKNILSSVETDRMMKQWIEFGKNGSAVKLVLFVLNEIFGYQKHQNMEHLKLFMDLLSPLIHPKRISASNVGTNLLKKLVAGTSNSSLKNRDFNLSTLCVYSLYLITKSLPNKNTNEEVEVEVQNNREKTVKELFIKISSHPDCVALFSPHLSMLLDKLGLKSVNFFSKCWVGSENLPDSSIMRSIDICGRLVSLNALKFDFRPLLVPLVCVGCSRHADQKDIRVSIRTLFRHMLASTKNQQQENKKNKNKKEVYEIEFVVPFKKLSVGKYTQILDHLCQSDITENVEDSIFRMEERIRPIFLEFMFSSFPNIESVDGKILLLKSCKKIRASNKKIKFTLNVLKDLVERIDELDVKETELLDLLLETIPPKVPSRDNWNTVLKVLLGLTKPIPNAPTYVPSQSCQDIVFTRSYFEKFSNLQRRETFLAVFEVFKDNRVRSRDITITFHRTLQRLSFPTKVITQIWNLVTKEDFSKRSKVQEEEEDQMEDEEADVQERPFHSTIVLLELLHLVEFQTPLSPFVLTLNKALSHILTLPAPPSYVVTLTLSLLTKLSNTLLKMIRADQEVSAEDSSSFSMELLLQVIESHSKREEDGDYVMGRRDSSSTSDIRTEILILFSSLVELVPSKVVPHMSPLLQFLGTSLQTRDAGTIEMVEKFVKKMVPFVISTSTHEQDQEEEEELVQENDKNEMIVSITSAYCDAWESLPQESRKRSFATLIKAVGRKRMYLVMIRYLSSVRNREEMDSGRRAEQQRDFARSLLRYFTIPKQVRCLVELIEYAEKIIRDPLKNHSSGFYEHFTSFADDDDDDDEEESESEEEEMMEEKYEFGLFLLEFVMKCLGHLDFLSDIANFERSSTSSSRGVIVAEKKKNEDVVQELILGLLIHSVRLYTSSKSQKSKMLEKKKKISSKLKDDDDEEEESEDEESDDDEDSDGTIDILDEINDTLDELIKKIMQLISTQNYVRFIVTLFRSTKKKKKKNDDDNERKKNLLILGKLIGILNNKLADKTMDNTKRLHINAKVYSVTLLQKIMKYLKNVNILTGSSTTKKKKKKKKKKKENDDVDLTFLSENTRLCQSLIITLELMVRRFSKFGKKRFQILVPQLINHFEKLSLILTQQQQTSLYFVKKMNNDEEEQQQEEGSRKKKEEEMEAYVISLSMTCCSYFKEMGMSVLGELPKMSDCMTRLFQKVSSVENFIRQKQQQKEENEEEEELELLDRRLKNVQLYVTSLKHGIYVLLTSHGQFLSSQTLKSVLDVLFHLSSNERKYEREEEDLERSGGTLSFSERMRNVMLETVPLRIALPMLLSSQIFQQARKMSGPGPFRFLMNMLSVLLRKSSSNDLVSFDDEIIHFFLTQALRIRERSKAKKKNNNKSVSPEMIEQEENQVIQTLVSYILKLNEERLFELVDKILSWTCDDKNEVNYFRLILFFKIMNKVIDKLEVFFLPLSCGTKQENKFTFIDNNNNNRKNMIEICGNIIHKICSVSNNNNKKKKKPKKKKEDEILFSGGGRKRLFSEREEEQQKEQTTTTTEDDQLFTTSSKDVTHIFCLMFEFMEKVFSHLSSKKGKEVINKSNKNKKKRRKKKDDDDMEDDLLMKNVGEEEEDDDDEEDGVRKEEKEILKIYNSMQEHFLIPMVSQVEIIQLIVDAEEEEIGHEEIMGMYVQREKKWLDCLSSMISCVPNSNDFHDTVHNLFISYIQKTIMLSTQQQASSEEKKERIILSFLKGLNACYESSLTGYVGYLPKSVPLMKEVQGKYGDENETIAAEIEEFIEIVEEFEMDDGDEVEVRDLIMN